MNNQKNIVIWVPLNNQILKFPIKNINSNNLNLYLNWIRKLDQNNLNIKLGLWDSNISYRKSNDKLTTKLVPSFYEIRQTWNEFIFSLITNYDSTQEKLNIPFDPLSFETFLYLSTLLKLFWRDIAGNLNSNVMVKIQLRVQLKKNRLRFKYNKIFK